jgi:hypothetical protein
MAVGTIAVLLTGLYWGEKLMISKIMDGEDGDEEENEIHNQLG